MWHFKATPGTHAYTLYLLLVGTLCWFILTPDLQGRYKFNCTYIAHESLKSYTCIVCVKPYKLTVGMWLLLFTHVQFSLKWLQYFQPYKVENARLDYYSSVSNSSIFHKGFTEVVINVCDSVIELPHWNDELPVGLDTVALNLKEDIHLWCAHCGLFYQTTYITTFL